MKNHYKKATVAVIAAIITLTSCSRELTSIPHASKLANVQTLEKEKAPVQKTEPLALIKTEAVQPIAETSPTVLPAAHNGTRVVEQPEKITHNSVASLFIKKAAHKILKQANTITHLGSANQIASHLKTTDGGSWIGLAITCLIVAVILFALGFGFAAAIVWEIGIIILVVAIVFFILWLLARAVAG